MNAQAEQLTSGYPFAVNLPLKLLQEVRLVHALTESGHLLHLSGQQANIISYIKKYFDITFKTGTDNIPFLPGVGLSHKEPSTWIGSIQRSLIFPHAIVTYCRTIWPDIRNIPVSFTGLLTVARRNVIEAYARRQNIQITLSQAPSLSLKEQCSDKYRGAPPPQPHHLSPCTIVLHPSDRGRKFPIKSWDERYYELLVNSKFVLCPDGDYTWTYRFFEALLCGAIPIVESTCNAYSGYIYYTMDTSTKDLVWAQHLADHNFNLCRERLTIPPEILNKEIALLLQH